MAITLPQKTPCQYSSSTGFPPAFPSVGDTTAYFLLAFSNQTNLQKALELRGDKRCQLGENWWSASLSKSRVNRANYFGAKANTG